MREVNIAESQLEEYKKNLTEVYFKSQEEFEKKLSFISASGFGASIFLIENVVGKLSDSSNKGVLFTSWIMLGGTLLLNLFSHMVSANTSWATLNDILNNRYDGKIALERQHSVKVLNYCCIVLLCLGLILLILFFTLNI